MATPFAQSLSIAPVRLELRYLRPIELATLAASAPDQMLGGALLSRHAAPKSLPPDLPLAHVRVAPLAPHEEAVECWLSDGIHRRVTVGPARCAWNDELLFGAVDPARIARSPGASLARITHATYDALFAALAHAGSPHLLRVWNYMPAINRAAGEPEGLERYRQFNIGRADAYLAHGVHHEEGAPAASALGTSGGDLTVYFLAARRAPRAVENPRQVSAYRYPPIYGPRSPSFSRAALFELDGRPHLFISGTASIVGDATVHLGDVEAQTRETFANLQAVVDATNEALAAPRFVLDDLSFKAYIRRAADLPRVEHAVAELFGAHVQIRYVQADICRADLLVEIEAFGAAA